MDNTEDSEMNYENRLFLLTIIGKDFSEIINDFDKLYNSFFKDYKEEVIQYGNSIFFVSDRKINEITDDFSEQMGKDFAYVLIDITDNLNQYDFKGNMSEKHAFSDRFVNLVKRFLPTKKESVVEKISLEDELEIAISNEDYERASEIRDEMKERLVEQK